MTNAEHYFENLLFHGKDEYHPNHLPHEVEMAVKECYYYVIYNIFDNQEDFLNYMKLK